MAVTSGTVWSVHTVRSDHQDPVQIAEVLFTMNPADTYAQADNSRLAAVGTLIQNSRRNGKTVTIHQAIGSQQARKHTDPALMMGIKTAAVAAGSVTFEITESATPGAPDLTTELANGLIPAQECPFGMYVLFTEA